MGSEMAYFLCTDNGVSNPIISDLAQSEVFTH